MKYSVSPVRYWLPVMFRSVVRPSMRALPTLLRSRKERRYRSVKGGRRVRSSFRTSAASLIVSPVSSLPAVSIFVSFSATTGDCSLGVSLSVDAIARRI